LVLESIGPILRVSVIAFPELLDVEEQIAHGNTERDRIQQVFPDVINVFLGVEGGLKSINLINKKAKKRRVLIKVKN